MSEVTDADGLVAKVEKSGDFTDDEVKTLKKMADAWKGLEAFGRVAGVVKKVLTWLGWAVATYLAWKAGAIDAIRGVVSK
jgi:hypothetical protein